MAEIYLFKLLIYDFFNFDEFLCDDNLNEFLLDYLSYSSFLAAN